MLQGLVVEEVKHVLDGEGQSRASVSYAEYCLKEVVNELLKRELGGEQPREVDLRDHLVGALLPFSLLRLLLTHQMPHLRQGGTPSAITSTLQLVTLEIICCVRRSCWCSIWLELISWIYNT